MAIARSGRVWRPIFFVLLIAVSASYYFYAQREFPHGGSNWGLAYGIAGTALILLLAFFGIRKRWYRSTFGTLEQWLQSHIYLGLLVLVVLMFHTGMRFNDRVAVATLVLVIIVVASGIFGAILYVTVPRMLTEVESNLSVEDMSDQLNQLARAMARIASGRSAAFQRIHDELAKQTMPRGLAGWRLLVSRRTSGEAGSGRLGAIDRARAEAKNRKTCARCSSCRASAKSSSCAWSISSGTRTSWRPGCTSTCRSPSPCW